MLTREEILDAAEEVLRRYGPAKANVVDVARALNVSHGSVYRHFPSKAALREAVAERWLESVAQPLAALQPREHRPQPRTRPSADPGRGSQGRDRRPSGDRVGAEPR